MIPTWYWLSRALHAISTQGKSDRTGTVAMVEFRLGHSTTAIVGPLCWSLQTESHAAMSCKIWKLHSDQFIKVLTTLKKKHLFGCQLCDIHCKERILRLHRYSFSVLCRSLPASALLTAYSTCSRKQSQEWISRCIAHLCHLQIFLSSEFQTQWQRLKWFPMALVSIECANKTHNCEGCY